MKRVILFIFIPFIFFHFPLLANQEQTPINIEQNTFYNYSKKYGMRSSLRLKYFLKLIKDLNDKTQLQKLYEVNKIVNKAIHYVDDKKLWNKDNYLATPLETLGMGYGDTEDIAMLKKLVLISFGFDSSSLKLIQKDILFINKKSHKSKENIALAYFKQNSNDPVVLDHKLQKEETLYRLKKRYSFQIIKTIPNYNKSYDEVFNKNFSINSINTLFNNIK